MLSSRQVVRRALGLPRRSRRNGVPLLARRRAYATGQPTTQESASDEADMEYPPPPDVSRQYLPPTGWQDNLMRRNDGDPLHERDELYSMWGPDIPPNSISPYTALWHFLIAASGIVGVGFLIKSMTPDPPAVRRQYPYDGLVKELGGLQENKASPLMEGGK